MNRKVVDIFAVIGAASTVIATGFGIFFGYQSLNSPGIVVDGVADIIDTGREGNEISKDILTAVSPTDSIETLTRRGYSWSQPEFLRALSLGDDDSLSLFCNAGPVGVFTKSLLDMVSPETDLYATPSRIADLRNCPAFRATSVCEDDAVLIALHERFDWDAFGDLCGRSGSERLRAAAEAAADEEHTEALKYCENFGKVHASLQSAYGQNFMLTWSAHRTWHRFGGPHSAAAFCKGVESYRG